VYGKIWKVPTLYIENNKKILTCVYWPVLSPEAKVGKRGSSEFDIEIVPCRLH